MTGEAHALKALFGENSSGSASYKLAVATVCSRLSGVFASLKVSSSSWSVPPLCPLPGPYLYLSLHSSNLQHVKLMY